MYNVLLNSVSGNLRFDELLGFMASAFWLRILVMLRITKLFGPLIRIIQAILKELGIFMVLWAIQLFAFSCAGFILFGHLKEYDTLFKVLIKMFMHALGAITPHDIKAGNEKNF